jgi:hypothetical protein
MIWIAFLGQVVAVLGVLWHPLGTDLSPIVMVLGGGLTTLWALGQACTDWRVRRSRNIERQVDREWGLR